MSTPKNYIASGISRKLLTPCRRVGLSRSKKTPNKINAPLINTAVNTPYKNLEVHYDEGKKQIKYKETPEKRSLELSSKYTKKSNTALKTVLSNIAEVAKSPESPKRELNNCVNSINVPTNKKKSLLSKSPIQDVVFNPVVTVEVHNSGAKRSINFNMIDECSALGSALSKEEKSIVKNDTSALIHAPSSHEIEETPVLNKKRKLILESNHFTSKSNEKLLHHDSVKSGMSPENSTKSTTRSTIMKRSCITSNGSSSGITLGRFTTEDYLKEYSSNPDTFQKNFDGNCSVVETLITNNEDSQAFSSSLNDIKSEKLKREDASSTIKNSCLSECKSKKNYVAILCTSDVRQSVDAKPKRSLSTKKFSSKFDRPEERGLTTEESNLKQKLTVSLERLTKEAVKQKVKSDCNKDISSKGFPSSLNSRQSNTVYLKQCNFPEDDDDLFTSSPDIDKKQHEKLLHLILNVENEIKQKQGKLEKLKQAQVYKKKHSPEKLKVSSDRWLEGCRAGLNDLLKKMQEHGPIEMDTLTKKLRISDNILEKLKL